MNAINHNNNNNRYNNDKTMTTPSIKINFQGASRDVNVPAPVSLASLQAAIAAAFDAELPVRSPAGEAAKDTDLSFTYKDPDGDDIVFDKDSELKLAVRLCPSSLEISATLKESEPAKKPDPEARLYKIAARNLREYNGVPSMTAPKLIKTLAFLKLNPQRLVKQGLAPKVLLARMKAEAANNAKVSKVPLGDGKNNEDLAESVAAGMELMSVEDDKKEWNDGFVSAESDASAAAVPITAKTSTPDNDNEEENNDAAPETKKDLIHKAFITGGIQLRPREVRPLLVALDVRPCRLAKLGLVDGKDLRAMLRAEKKAAHKRCDHGNNNDDTAALHHRRHHHRDYHRQQHRMAGRPHPFAPPPPSPPAHQEVGDAMFAARGGRGRHGSPHRHGPPHRHGAPHQHGPPPPMKGMMRGGRPHPFAPPPPPAHMEDPGDAPGGGGGGHRGVPLFHPVHQHYAEVFDEDERGHPGVHPHHGPPRWMAIRNSHGGGYGGGYGGGVGQQQRRDFYWG
ncbi:unnamed protein product [Ectocarpus sp. CCAP 1310/34]|nr:unnamed protein product [Ectocarpus sp. CCAP 1310/34]